MGKIDPSIPGCSFTQSSDEIQKILNNVAGLSDENVSELISLLNEIKNINTDPDDDAQSIGQQLLAVLDSMVKENEVQTEVNDSTYPPQSKAVKAAVTQINNKIQTSTTSLKTDLTNKISAEQTARQSADTQLLNQTVQAINTLKNLLYRQEEGYGKVPISITEAFTLSFKCQSYTNKGIPYGTWVCSDLDALYTNIKFNGHALEKHPSQYMAITDIIVSDGYLEDDRWIVYIDINLNPEDIDSFPVGSLCGYSSEETFNYNQTYPYVANVTDTYARIALGTIVLPDDDVVVGGSELLLNVPATDLGNILVKNEGITYTTPIIGDIDDMEINADTLIEAINYLNGNIPNGGTWHYGDKLTHTENAKPVTLNVGAKAGDFYLNIQHFYVYYTQNGNDWTYIGNLTGSVDTSKWAPINSPVFTGAPMAPTATTTNNSAQIATTEFVRNAIDKYASGGDNTGNIGNILVPLFLSQLTAHVDIWTDAESPGSDARIVSVAATKSWITAEIPTIEYDSNAYFATELTDIVLYCQITSSGIYVGICRVGNAPHGALTSALPNKGGNNIEITLI